MKKTALVLGAGGFIGSHLVKRLKIEGYWVRGVDLKYPEFDETAADDFIIGDLRAYEVCQRSIDQSFDEIYQLAADMGGAGFVFSGENDADIMHNSALININTLDVAWKRNSKKIFYSSSACMYPESNQLDPENPMTAEDSAYPAQPDSEYGWEKLLVSDYFFHIIVIREWIFVSPVFIIFLEFLVLGMEVEKKHLLHYVGKLLWRKMATK